MTHRETKLNNPEKLGLAFSKEELEEITHEGPVKPKHVGAFEIKESYMDMSSSDEETKGEAQIQKKPVVDPRFDPQAPHNQEIILRNIQLPSNFNFDRLFVLGDGQKQPIKDLFGE